MDGRGQETAEVLLQDEKPEKLRVAPLHVNKPRQDDRRQEQPSSRSWIRGRQACQRLTMTQMTQTSPASTSATGPLVRTARARAR